MPRDIKTLEVLIGRPLIVIQKAFLSLNDKQKKAIRSKYGFMLDRVNQNYPRNFDALINNSVTRLKFLIEKIKDGEITIEEEEQIIDQMKNDGYDQLFSNVPQQSKSTTQESQDINPNSYINMMFDEALKCIDESQARYLRENRNLEQIKASYPKYLEITIRNILEFLKPYLPTQPVKNFQRGSSSLPTRIALSSVPKPAETRFLGRFTKIAVKNAMDKLSSYDQMLLKENNYSLLKEAIDSFPKSNSPTEDGLFIHLKLFIKGYQDKLKKSANQAAKQAMERQPGGVKRFFKGDLDRAVRNVLASPLTNEIILSLGGTKDAIMIKLFYGINEEVPLLSLEKVANKIGNTSVAEVKAAIEKFYDIFISRINADKMVTLGCDALKEKDGESTGASKTYFNGTFSDKRN